MTGHQLPAAECSSKVRQCISPKAITERLGLAQRAGQEMILSYQGNRLPGPVTVEAVPKVVGRKSGSGSQICLISNAILALLFAICFFFVTSAPGHAKRVALVVGNDSYSHVTQLRNAAADAEDIASLLKQLQFDVELKKNLGENDLELAIADFADAAVGADMAIFYYAGHGIELDKQNYIIPIDAKLSTDRALLFEAIPLERLMLALDGVKGVRLIFLDACRNSPFRSQMSMTNASRAIGTGLSRVDAPDGTVISFSAEEGKEARDGLGRNSPFATALLKFLAVPGLELQFLLRNVRDEVKTLTDGEQMPYISASLPSTPIYVVPSGDGRPSKTLEPISPDELSTISSIDRDKVAEDYSRAERLNSAQAWELFIERYDTAEDDDTRFYVSLARTALQAAVSGKDVETANQDPVSSPGNVSEPPIPINQHTSSKPQPDVDSSPGPSAKKAGAKTSKKKVGPTSRKASQTKSQGRAASARKSGKAVPQQAQTSSKRISTKSKASTCASDKLSNAECPPSKRKVKLGSGGDRGGRRGGDGRSGGKL